MTKAEYRKAYAAARKNWPNLTNETMLELRSTYIAASKEAAAIVRDATRRGLSSITSGQYLNLQGQLDRAVTRLSEAIDAGVRSTVTAGWNSYANIETQYIVDSAIKADVLTKIGGSTQIRNFFTGLSSTVVTDMISRTYADGHIYSTRVWNAALDYKTQINRVVSTGLSLNRDTISIARDIQVYTADGKTALMQRYGDLEYGTKRFTRRIRKRVDYRALRLVRSELAASLQNAALIAGQNNPASNGLYDWIRVNVQEWGCDCPRYQEEGPYRLEDVPDYPHANCECMVRPQLINNDVFVNDLIRWDQGDDVGYINAWVEKINAI